MLKQTWHRLKTSEDQRSYRAVTEKDFLGPEPIPHVGNILRSTQVGISLKNTVTVDSTSNLRGDYPGRLAYWNDGIEVPPASSKHDVTRDEHTREQLTTIKSSTAAEHNVQNDTPFVSRVLMRTLMSTYGWPIKYFKDLEELVTVLRDAVTGA